MTKRRTSKIMAEEKHRIEIQDGDDNSQESGSSDHEHMKSDRDESAASKEERAGKKNEPTLDPQLEAEADAAVKAAEESTGDTVSTAAESVAAEEKTPGQMLDDALAEVATWKDKFLRLHAEWDTYKRRKAEEVERNKSTATEDLVRDLIPVIDDLERTIDYATKNGEAGLIDGVGKVLNKFTDTLGRRGVEIIDPKGEAFNALEHQAVGTQEDDTQPNETVCEVYQKGYKMGNKVLRPSAVVVTTGGPPAGPDEGKREEAAEGADGNDDEKKTDNE